MRLSVDDHGALARTIADFLAGERSLTGLDLYYQLERSTPLLEFHTVLRRGPRNRDHSGLQQSYGDHNRLLMLGLDKLMDGDLAWYSTRLDVGSEVSEVDLLACFRAVAELGITSEVLVALWLGAALHDCGMLCGRGASIDVEDGVVLGRDLVAELCPAGLDTLATFVLRHHDYIKGAFLGEVPCALIADDLALIDPAKRRMALVGLGLVQVAGAASLGEGRLERFRMELCERCLDGSALDDETVLTRLGRLLAATPNAARPTSDRAASALDGLEANQRDTLVSFLARVAVHRWQRVAEALGPDERIAALVSVADAWAGTDADHVVLAGDAPRDSASASPSFSVARMDTALSGLRFCVLDRVTVAPPTRPA